jgi:zinc and cadmium transporter
MSTLTWIVFAGLAMSSLALVGMVTVFMPSARLERIVLPIGGLAAGSLLGGAMFHMLPESMDAIGNRLGVDVAFVAGFVVFFVLEQFLHCIVAWLVAAAHEVPQELGDFGVLMHSGWQRRSALVWNFASALTFLLGSLVAYAMAEHIEVAYLLPFAAGNFVYIAAADLLPEIAAEEHTRDKIETTVAFIVGLAILLAASQLA